MDEQQVPQVPEAPVERSMADSLRRFIEHEGGTLPPEDRPREPDGKFARPLAPETPTEVAQQPEVDAAPVEEEAPAEEAVAEDEYVEVELDGATYKVPAKIKDGYLRQADYSRKMNDADTSIRAAQEAASAAAETYKIIQGFAPLIGKFTNAQAKQQQYSQITPDQWNQLTDLERTQIRMDAMENSREIENLSKQFQEAPNILRAMEQQQIHALAQRNRPRALELVPDLPKRASEFAKVGHEVYGFTPEELGSISDPRMIHALRDLAEYHKSKQGLTEIRQQIQKAPPVAKPGAKAAPATVTTKDYTAAVRAMKSDNSPEAFMAALRTQRKLQG